jgi:Raf kinase inhibitor-like YbhB/YbcL family protein
MRDRGFMRLIIVGFGVLAFAALAGAGDRYAQRGTPPGDDSGATDASAHFVLASADLPEHGMMHRQQVKDGCGGENISPALEWHNPPAGTQSFALLMHDPDAPEAHGFWHWVVYDIPATVTSLPRGAGEVNKRLMPAGAIQGRSDFGTVGYGGPCPPPGAPHRYVFRLYALPVARLNVPPETTGDILSAYANASSLGKAQLIARYGR